MSRAILLFAHGARDPEWARPFEAIRAAIAQQAVDVPVALCFLELMTPDLPTAARQLLAQGATRLVVIPLFMAQGGHLRKDLPRLIADLLEAHPQLEITLAPAIGEVPALTTAIASWACAYALRAHPG
ncbi:MAG: CbiX/SirB N-terminal domain-containing protein [Pseudomonadota bacterium]|nr:CbiX/SirB N-terminal domain-containing protein [Pseudomonadota bacterium]